ncbi:MAG TPA: FAD-dependent oxidoreductase [Solirubrobacteraceae bacterium]|jgi:phytoene dehydrogenase-like protein|nr:FAD-dependent oxidoreductase [Solirubrobacteraceae bacterium]
MSRRRVVVIGGGVAGIAAALDCADAGAQVTLIEVRPRLGGAAYSFERDGLCLDNGQHVFLRCYTAYRDLLARLGSDRMVEIQPRFAIPVLRPGGQRVTLRRSGLPAPFHLAGALARYSYLTPLQRVRAARAAIALARLDLVAAAVRERADGTSFGQWLAEHGQDERALALLWDLIALPALNVPALQGSLSLGAFTVREGLFSCNDAGDIGFHLRPFGETIAEPAQRVLAAAGVQVRLGTRVEAVRREGGPPAAPAGGKVFGRGEGCGGRERSAVVSAGSDAGAKRGAGLVVSAAGVELVADAVVCAIPHTRAADLLEPLLGEREASRWRRLGVSPIINVHVVYDRTVCDLPFAAGVETPVQYVFDRTEAVGLDADRRSPPRSGRTAGSPGGQQCLAVSLSGAEREMEMDGEQLRRRYLGALAELFPAARDAEVRSVFVSREHAATFKATPGVDALRPPTRTRVEGLVLAGAWTRTGWPATLEGAVRSGHAAARAAIAA